MALLKLGGAGPRGRMVAPATRDPANGPQGVPVNRTAVDAGTRDVDLAAFRLRVQGKVAPTTASPCV